MGKPDRGPRDEWGRGIRYGLLPEGRDEAQRAERSQVIAANVEFANRIYEYEVIATDVLRAGPKEALRRELTTDAEIAALAEEMYQERVAGPMEVMTAAAVMVRELRASVP